MIVTVGVTFTHRNKFELADLVRKKKGSWWEGRVVGFYSTNDTPIGYCVQLEKPRGNGPVQIYPEAALELVRKASECE